MQLDTDGLLVPRRRNQVKSSRQNRGPRPSGRPRSLALALRVAGVLLAVLGCHLQPPALERAHLLAEHGKEAEAIAVLDEHLATHPQDIAERRQLIRLYGSIGRMDQASAQTERLAEILPRDSPIPWIELGHAYELSHRYDEALAAYDRASQLAPRDPVGPKSGGLRAARWGELGLAEPRLEEAVRREPRDAEAWHALGLVRVGLGKLEAARRAYSSGLHADPQALENHLGLATVALRENQPEAALAEYELLLAARPRFTAALLGKSWALILLGRFDAADAALEQAAARGADRASIERQRLAIRERKLQPPKKTPGETPP